MYKVTRTLDGKIDALSQNIRDGQYIWVNVNSSKATKFTYKDAKAWVDHLSEIRKYADGSVRPRSKGFIQIVTDEYRV